MDQKNNNDDDDYIDGCCPNVIACIPNTIGDDLRWKGYAKKERPKNGPKNI